MWVEKPAKDRFIPTHVGNTVKSVEYLKVGSVHPHTRGEHVIPAHGDIDMTGSSPHTWGTRLKYSDNLVSARFIPTHVGNTIRLIQ